MRATLLHAFLVTQYSGALLVRRPLRPRAGAVVRTAAGSVARCEEKITAALEPTSLRVAHRVDKTSVGRMERNGYRRSPTRRTTQMARTSPSFAYSARALSTASTHGVVCTQVSALFEGLSRVKRQQLVMRSIRDELDSGAIHAIDSLQTCTPTEAEL
mmetsp:Transcript_5961/g.14413  ORF Transcript_5961/g.14413 Transcript_5961/m.14413 type:complete len:158 (-) Transcript_5961:23-496(-)